MCKSDMPETELLGDDGATASMHRKRYKGQQNVASHPILKGMIPKEDGGETSESLANPMGAEWASLSPKLSG